jgi:hypothetical protein
VSKHVEDGACDGVVQEIGEEVAHDLVGPKTVEGSGIAADEQLLGLRNRRTGSLKVCDSSWTVDGADGPYTVGAAGCYAQCEDQDGGDDE